MAIEIKRKEGEPVPSLLYRFTKKVRQSGVLLEARRRRFQRRSTNRGKRRLSALYRGKKRAEFARLKKLGLFP